MKLVGIRGASGAAEVAIVDRAKLTPLCSVAEFWTDPRGIVARPAREARVPVELAAAHLVPIVPSSARIICVGLNYRAHAGEGGFEVPDFPTIFGRWTASLSVGDAPVRVPAGEPGLDWEGEVAAYIGAEFAGGDADAARAAVFGYSTFNDLTARRAQKLTSQWTLGKNVDGSGPLGPLVTADEVGDLRDGLRVRTRVNGEVMQDASTAAMIFDVGQLISHLSTVFALHPGDVIATGTPEGVGYVRTPPRLLGDGDVVEVDIERLGVLRTPVLGADS
ncbi:fumarylacetoacetate hydrolase family protein [Nocardia sp. NPDC004722]